MSQWVAISRKEHRHYIWRRYQDFQHTAGDMLVPVLLPELIHLVPMMPLSIVANDPGSEHHTLVGVQSLEPGLNIYLLSDGHWLAPYVPAHYRSYPFQLLRTEDNQELLVMKADSTLINPQATQPDDLPLFAEEGQLHPELAKVVQFLKESEAHRQKTQAAVNQIIAHRLLIPWELTRQATPESPKQPVHGLTRIDEGRLKKLEALTLNQLNQIGALDIAYAMLYSYPRMHDIGKRYQMRTEAQNNDQHLDKGMTIMADDNDILKF
jgi:hypothetical protein